MTWLIIGVLVTVLVVSWLTWTATRLDRLNARCEAAWASLDAQLVRRAAAARAIADECGDAIGPAVSATLRDSAHAAMAADRSGRATAENNLSAQLTPIPAGPIEASAVGRVALKEFQDACVRVQMARTFYNDAVRDTRSLRGQWLPRVARLGRRASVPEFFDIDDSPGMQRV